MISGTLLMRAPYSTPNASGGVLFLPAGTYVLSNQAVAPSPSFQVGPDCMKLTGFDSLPSPMLHCHMMSRLRVSTPAFSQTEHHHTGSWPGFDDAEVHKELQSEGL